MACSVTPALAGVVVASGDTNIIDPLTGRAVFSTIDTGNQRLFTNLLDTGTRVLIATSSIPGTTSDLSTFYNALPGKTASVRTGDVRAIDLIGIDLFISPAHDTAYSTTELATISAFSAAGGTVLVTGDWATAYSPYNAIANTLLDAVGGGLRIVDANDSGLPRTATGTAITAHPLTSGVTTLSYNYTSRVTGGTTVVTNTAGFPFVTVVPEPAVSTLATGVLFCVRRRRGRLRS